jgi:hypothetical protein
MSQHDPVVEAKIKRGSGKPKYQIGDVVFRATRPFARYHDEEEPGRVISVYTKRNERGAYYFYYDVLWGSSRRPSTHAQHRLKLMTISPSQEK